MWGIMGRLYTLKVNTACTCWLVSLMVASGRGNNTASVCWSSFTAADAWTSSQVMKAWWFFSVFTDGLMTRNHREPAFLITERAQQRRHSHPGSLGIIQFWYSPAERKPFYQRQIPLKPLHGLLCGVFGLHVSPPPGMWAQIEQLIIRPLLEDLQSAISETKTKSCHKVDSAVAVVTLQPPIKLWNTTAPK